MASAVDALELSECIFGDVVNFIRRFDIIIVWLRGQSAGPSTELDGDGVSFLVLWKGILRLCGRLPYVSHDAPEHVCDATLI